MDFEKCDPGLLCNLSPTHPFSIWIIAFLRFCLLATTPYLGNSRGWLKKVAISGDGRTLHNSLCHVSDTSDYTFLSFSLFRSVSVTFSFCLLSICQSVYLSIFLFVSDYLFVYLFAYICDLFSCQFVHFLVSLSTFLFPISRFLYLKYHFMSLFSLSLTQT